jgi:hypothetical protein
MLTVARNASSGVTEPIVAGLKRLQYAGFKKFGDESQPH